MVSAMHTIFVNLFTSAPNVLFALAPELPSDDAVTLLSEDYTQYPPAEYRADAVLCVGEPPRALIVLEVQRRIDKRKRWTWPLYLAAASAQNTLPSTLVVVAATPSVAEWASAMFPRGQITGGRPVVLSLSSIIEAGSADALRHSPELAVAVMSSYRELGRKPPDTLGLTAFNAVKDATARLADDERAFYTDLVLSALTDTLRAELENMMNQRNWEPQSQFIKDLFAREAAALEQGIEQGIEQGTLQSRRAALNAVLAARGIALTEEQHTTLHACEDVTQLDRWIAQAAIAEVAAEFIRG